MAIVIIVFHFFVGKAYFLHHPSVKKNVFLVLKSYLEDPETKIFLATIDYTRYSYKTICWGFDSSVIGRIFRRSSSWINHRRENSSRLKFNIAQKVGIRNALKCNVWHDSKINYMLIKIVIFTEWKGDTK